MNIDQSTMTVEQVPYAERDIMALDREGGYYARHVSAMTKHGLHSKSDIAAELAWRDQQIAALRAEIARVGGERSGKATTPPARASYYEPDRSGSASTPEEPK